MLDIIAKSEQKKWTRNVKRWTENSEWHPKWQSKWHPKRQRNDTQEAKDDTKNSEYDTKNDTKN